MRVINSHLTVSLASALIGTLAVAFILSYWYPVIIGGAEASPYIRESFFGNRENWRLVFAVFLIASVVTISVFLFASLAAFIPLLYIFPRLNNASIYAYLLLGFGASLLILIASWLIQVASGVLTAGDFFFTLLAVVIDGPVAMLIFWFVSKQIRITKAE